jgi:hypothetical protein
MEEEARRLMPSDVGNEGHRTPVQFVHSREEKGTNGGSGCGGAADLTVVAALA